MLPQIKPTRKGPKTMAFSKYFSDYNTSSQFTTLSKCFNRATFDLHAADFLNNRT